MLISALKKGLQDHEIREITESDYGDVFRLQQTNPDYFELEDGHAVTYESCIQGIKEVPPGTQTNQKHYIGAYSEEKLEAIIAYIEGYSYQKDSFHTLTVWIGLMMVDGNSRGCGKGTIIVRSFIEALKEAGYRRLQIGCLISNKRAFAFWSKLGFKEIDRVLTREKGRQDWHIIVMENTVEEGEM